MILHVVGPGLVHLLFATALGVITVIECVTPVGPLLQKYYHSVYGASFVVCDRIRSKLTTNAARWTVPRPVCKLVLRGLVIQSEKDIPGGVAHDFAALSPRRQARVGQPKAEIV